MTTLPDRLSAASSDPAEVKSCCAAVYSSDWVRLLLGDSFHPGGVPLTDRLAELLELGPGTRVVDVATGRGTSAIHLAQRWGCEVVGVDLSATNVEAAQRGAADAGVADLTTFMLGDAESVGLPAECFDAAICECAFCTFPDKQAAAVEMARLIRPGGHVGISDLTRQGDLPAELDSLIAWVMCIADARPLDEYVAHLRDAGMEAVGVEPHDDALVEMAEGIRAKLTAARFLVELKRLDLSAADLERGQTTARAAVDAVRAGRLGYAVITATKPS